MIKVNSYFMLVCWSCLEIDILVSSRVGNATTEHNISSFMLEMKETAFICNNATPKSLILIDELGRATSNEDGVSIAWAVSEKLLAKRAMTFFVTHYPQLCQLATVYPCVQNQHLEAFVSRETNNAGISYTHKIAPGPCNVTSEYGIDMAMACGWPATAVENVSPMVITWKDLKVLGILNAYTFSFHSQARKIETAVRDKLPRDGFCEVTSEQYDSPTTMEAKKKLLDICEKAQQLVNEESNLGSLRIKLQVCSVLFWDISSPSCFSSSHTPSSYEYLLAVENVCRELGLRSQ
jgi:DNA mismatch repair ATPase MutS